MSDWLLDYNYCWLVCRKPEVFFVRPVNAANGNKIIVTCFFVFCYLEHSFIASNNYRKRIIFVIKRDNLSLPFMSWTRDTDSFLGPRSSCQLMWFSLCYTTDADWCRCINSLYNFLYCYKWLLRFLKSSTSYCFLCRQASWATDGY